MLMTQEPVLVWSLIASMFIGNVILLILNLPLAPRLRLAAAHPYAYLAPGILALSLVGAYAATLTFYTVVVAIGFGVVGYLMIKADLPRAPLVLALVLAPLLEILAAPVACCCRSAARSSSSERPIAAGLLALVVLSIVLPFFFAARRHMARRRAAAMLGGED